MSASTSKKIEKAVGEALKRAGATRVLAAVSGGPDSVALLSALRSVSGIDLMAAHCNFHLRGEESRRDELEVEKLCVRLGVDLIKTDFNVAEYMKLHKGTSIEMACRELRYRWFSTLLEKFGFQRVATGHNSDDNAETLFLNLLRGSGTTGLRGMAPDNGTVIRPLLEVSRKEILEYLENIGLGYVTDSSNLSSDYRRNFLRNEIFPALRTRWAGADTAISRTLHNIREENKVVEATVAAALPEAGKPLHISSIMEFPSPELLVRRFIQPLRPLTTTAREILAAIRAGKSDVRRWNLPGGRIELRGSKLYLFIE